MATDVSTSLQGRRILVVGSGAIATGVAAVAAIAEAQVTVNARSDSSRQRAEGLLQRAAERAPSPFTVPFVTVGEPAVAEAEIVVEAIIEDFEAKSRLLTALGGALAPDALLATTTSSLSISDLAEASGVPDRFFGLHVFNPVPRMQLVELVFGSEASATTRATAHELCAAMGKSPVVAPDLPGFIVNRLLFPALFSAVRLVEETDLEAADVDLAMRLGAGHPMGPLALLDFVGLDVAAAIGESLDEEVPELIRICIAEGRLGRKSGSGLLEAQ